MWSSSLSRREKYSVAVLSITALALRVPLALRPERALTGLPYTDDAYYLFSIARHLAAGHGPSVEGVHLTNGFQPLIVLLYTPIFWLCGTDAWLAVRWSFILNGVIAALSVWAVALVMRVLEREPQRNGLTAPIIAAALWMGTFEIFGQMTNGLETGLLSLLLLLAIMLYAGILKDRANNARVSLWRWAGFGAVLGLVVLTRIDAAILVAIFATMLFFERRPREAIVVGAIALLMSLPWWIYNWAAFGSLMPSSGQAENSWPMPPFENIAKATEAISEIATLIVYLPHTLGRTVYGIWTFLLVPGLAWAFYRTRLREVFRLFRMKVLLPFLLFSLALLIFYVFFFRAPHFISRYLQPGRMLWSIVVAASAWMLWHGTNPRTARPVMLALAALGLFFFLAGYRVAFLTVPRSFDFYEMGEWAAQHPAEKIGMLQSGITSFIAPNVINLDGKVNSEALRAHQQGRLAEYLRNEHFTYIADWKPFIEDIDTIARRDELYFDSVGMVGYVQIMKLRMASSDTP